MPVKDAEFDGKLYFNDGFEWVEAGVLDEIHELSTGIVNAEGKEAKFEGCFDAFPVFEWNYEVSLRPDLYLWRMQNGIFTYLVPNNWRRMHGFRVRRRSVAKRRAEKAFDKEFLCK